jgi:hypothetical protein
MPTTRIGGFVASLFYCCLTLNSLSRGSSFQVKRMHATRCWPASLLRDQSTVVHLGNQDLGGPQSSDDFLEYSIDSFLRGEYNRPFADDAAAPLPGLTPGSTVEQALRSLRQLDDPEPSHGAAVLLRFCAPLSRGERWGASPSSGRDQWKEILRGSLTPTMLARRIRASEVFSGLLDWTKLDVTEGAYAGEKDLIGVPSVAFVNAALYFEDGMEPTLIQFSLRRIGGVWLIDTARKSDKKLFMENDTTDSLE